MCSQGALLNIGNLMPFNIFHKCGYANCERKVYDYVATSLCSVCIEDLYAKLKPKGFKSTLAKSVYLCNSLDCGTIAHAQIRLNVCEGHFAKLTNRLIPDGFICRSSSPEFFTSSS
jgi:hypothetical protein